MDEKSNVEPKKCDDLCKIIQVCPECLNSIFIHDIIRDETYCKKCGLILDAPYHHTILPTVKIVFPHPKRIKIRLSNDN
jgi:hypothetical protein